MRSPKYHYYHIVISHQSKILDLRKYLGKLYYVIIRCLIWGLHWGLGLDSADRGVRTRVEHWGVRQVYGTVSYWDRLTVANSLEHAFLTLVHSLRSLLDYSIITYVSHLWQFHLHGWGVEGLEWDVSDALAALADEGGVGHVPLLSKSSLALSSSSSLSSLTCLRSVQDWVGLKVGQDPQPASITEARVMITSHTGIWTTESENRSHPENNGQ